VIYRGANPAKAFSRQFFISKSRSSLLISRLMIDAESYMDTGNCRLHPLFWQLLDEKQGLSDNFRYIQDGQKYVDSPIVMFSSL
jgi:hypothetical protein